MCADGATRLLLEAGFERISEREDWKLEVGRKYFFTRNYSTIVAFAIGKQSVDHRMLNSVFIIIIIIYNVGCVFFEFGDWFIG